jgi:hypothetical protein
MFASLRGRYVMFGEVWDSTTDFPNVTKAHLLLESLSHGGIARSLVVDFKGSLQTLRNFFLEQIHNPDAFERS